MIYGLYAFLNIIYFMVCLHFFQWKSYFKLRYIKYLFKNKLIIFINLLLIIQLILHFLGLKIVFLLIFYIFSIFLLFFILFKKKKIKFKFTPRLFRIFLINILFIFVFCLMGKSWIIMYAFLTPIGVVLCDIFDVQKLIIDNKFFNSALSRLESNKPPITIGITGSNGKTSIKEILLNLLSVKYKVYATKQNQNTLKGSIIALNYMPKDTEIFVCEMGARQVGDIKTICNFVGADLGVISSVSGQHLETFKTLDNVYKTKKELPDSLGEKLCVYNLDNELTRKMYAEKRGEKLGISTHSTADIYATDVRVENFQTLFTLHYQNHNYPCKTSMLGVHNVTNILLATAIAINLGIDIALIVGKISELKSPPHRLEYIRAYTDILDDTYNCSLDSATMALEVLKTSNKRKVICTPGIIEGGKEQAKINAKLSKMLNIADIVIIVGKTNKIALKSNLINFKIIEIKYKKIFGKINKQKICKFIENNAKKCAYFVNTLEIAKILFSKILDKNSILLLLNDLPDEYN